MKLENRSLMYRLLNFMFILARHTSGIIVLKGQLSAMFEMKDYCAANKISVKEILYDRAVTVLRVLAEIY